MSISLKELKKNRLTPAEKWLVDLIEGVEPTINPNGNVGWCKDCKWLFTQDLNSGLLLVGYLHVGLVLDETFGLNHDEVKELLPNILYDYTDNGKLKIFAI